MIDLETTERRYLRIDEVQELFGVSRKTVYNWVIRGFVKSIVIDRCTRIEVADLRRRLTYAKATVPLSTISLAIFRESCRRYTASAPTP